MSRYRKREEKKQLYKKLGIVAAVLAAGIAAVAGVLGFADNRLLQQETKKAESEEITYQGRTYLPKGNLETYLFAGIDATGMVKERDPQNPGQCDVLILLVRDRSTDTCQILSIDRNTMTDVRFYDDEQGEDQGTAEVQISLAHSMGADQASAEGCAENTVEAVSTLLGGITIDGYAMVNMSAIQTVNDMVGGVTVSIEDDFTGVDDTLKKGETITLNGEQAEHFIRGRMYMKDDATNQKRMNRQQQYEEGFKAAFTQKCAEDNTFPLDLYHGMEPYMTTTISAKKFSRLALLMIDEKEESTVQIEGTYGFDEEHWQTFTPDPDSLQSCILQMFYEERS